MWHNPFEPGEDGASQDLPQTGSLIPERAARRLNSTWARNAANLSNKPAAENEHGLVWKKVESSEAQLNFFSRPLPRGMAMWCGWSWRR